MKEQSLDIEVAAVGVSMQTQAGSGKDLTNITLQTHFPSDISSDDMDEQLDKLAGSLERQRVIGEIPAIIESIAKHNKSIDNILSDIDRIDTKAQKDWDKSGRSGSVKLSNANHKHREETANTIKHWRDMLDIEEKKLAIALETRGTINVQQVKVAKTA